MTASDTVVIMGMSPYATPADLWYQKVSAEQLDETIPMWIGKSMEAAIAQKVIEQTGEQWEHCEDLYISDEYPWLGATPDYILRDETGKVVKVLEIKTTSNGGDWDEAPAPYAWLQAQTQAIVMGCEIVSVACLIHGRQPELKTYLDLPLEQMVADDIIILSKEFHECLMSLTPPSGFSNKIVSKMYPTSSEEAVEISAERVQRLKELKAIISELDKEATDIETEIKNQMKEAGIGTIGGKPVVTWKTSDTTRVDITLLKKMYPDIAKEVAKTTSTRRFLLK